ncbi:hypothetical protein AB0I22_33025 [Streptomyces sp. NPDC050610]|uniref:hypothetical protein n=1 Tax=Streptomyces sp. NPDC050610 TaxID=3157097 RepID=UPI003414CBBE
MLTNPAVLVTAPFLLILGLVFVLDQTERRSVLTVDATGLRRDCDPPSPSGSTHVPWADILYVGWLGQVVNVHSGTEEKQLLVRLRENAAVPPQLSRVSEPPSDGGAYYLLGTLGQFGISNPLLLREELLRHCPEDQRNDKGVLHGHLAGIHPLIF